MGVGEGACLAIYEWEDSFLRRRILAIEGLLEATVFVGAFRTHWTTVRAGEGEDVEVCFRCRTKNVVECWLRSFRAAADVQPG
jgi:hypothetical protein